MRRADVVAADLSHPFQPVVPKLAPGQPIDPELGDHALLARLRRSHDAVPHHQLPSGARIQQPGLFLRRSPRATHATTNRSFGATTVFTGHWREWTRGWRMPTGWWRPPGTRAYPVFNSRCSGKRFYFVQDFEPYFYPVGSMSLLAENTYRMGFHAITIGALLCRQAAFGVWHGRRLIRLRLRQHALPPDRRHRRGPAWCFTPGRMPRGGVSSSA